MTVAIIVGAASVALLVYWFRYTSLLILSTKTSQDFSFDIAHAHELQFPEMRVAIPETPPDRFHSLLNGIDHDYRLVSALLRNVETSENKASLEDVILRLDFAGLKLAYRLAQPFSEKIARGALAEMADVVAHLANTVGERSMANIGMSAV
jgi:hypothetical protein